MASLMENLISLLEQENGEYEKLLELSMQKTPVIIEGDISKLEKITDEEQIIVGKVNRLDKEREQVMQDIATVLNKDVQTLKLGKLTALLSGRPAEQQKLSEIHAKLKVTMNQMVRVNNQNRELIQSSLEMVQYNINVLKSMKAAPETANYTREAFNSGSTMGYEQKGFDAKQ